jgi:methyl-accepting chemotaxis protein
METIVSAVNQVTGIVAEISTASASQKHGVSLVGSAVVLMDQATQQNAALVEEMAAAASSLHSQSNDLVRTVSTFKLA